MILGILIFINVIRSKWKNVFVDIKLFNTVSNLVVFNNKQFIRIDSKKIRLFAGLLGKKLSIYNGRKNIVVFIRNSMFGRYLGSFVLTKRFSFDIHSSNNKKKREK